jgi:hypothetical protein
MFERWENQHFEDHLCPRPQDASRPSLSSSSGC